MEERSKGVRQRELAKRLKSLNNNIGTEHGEVA